MTHAHGPTAAPNQPHGGELVDRLLNGQAARRAHVHLSGTEVRRFLKAGEMPPPEFSWPEVAEVLVEVFHPRETR